MGTAHFCAAVVLELRTESAAEHRKTSGHSVWCLVFRMQALWTTPAPRRIHFKANRLLSGRIYFSITNPQDCEYNREKKKSKEPKKMLLKTNRLFEKSAEWRVLQKKGGERKTEVNRRKKNREEEKKKSRQTVAVFRVPLHGFVKVLRRSPAHPPRMVLERGLWHKLDVNLRLNVFHDLPKLTQTEA